MSCPIEGCSNPGTTGSPECIKHKFAGGIRVNGLHRFRNDREMGLTQAARGREMAATAKADGKDIMQVIGRRRPHEKKINGVWEKV